MAESALRETFPSRSATNYRVEPLKTVITGDARPAPLLLVAAAAVVCSSRSETWRAFCLRGQSSANERSPCARHSEPGAAASLASSSRKGIGLSLAGAVAGWILATWATRALVAFAPANLPRLSEIRGSARPGLHGARRRRSGVLFNASPVIQLVEPGFVETLQAGVRSSSRAGARRLRSALIVAELRSRSCSPSALPFWPGA